MSTMVEQFQAATLSLSGAGTIKDRLTEAYSNHLAQLDAQDLPGELRDQFLALNKALARERPLRGEDPFRATIRKMSSQEAADAAASIVRMYGTLCHDSPGDVRASASVVPLYLAKG
ncbi:MAG TPA: hypothetical protein VIY54_11040 [Steroidobacteraceae bacterium]